MTNMELDLEANLKTTTALLDGDRLESGGEIDDGIADADLMDATGAGFWECMELCGVACGMEVLEGCGWFCLGTSWSGPIGFTAGLVGVGIGGGAISAGFGYMVAC